MSVESWLPIGFELPGGVIYERTLFGALDWQIVKTQGGAAVIARETLCDKWRDATLLPQDELRKFAFGSESFCALTCTKDFVLAPLAQCHSPNNKKQAMAFARALRATRAIDPCTSLRDAIYVEELGRLLPTYESGVDTDDGLVLGRWLTGGAAISTASFQRLRHILSWLEPDDVSDIVIAAGLELTDQISLEAKLATAQEDAAEDGRMGGTVAGRLSKAAHQRSDPSSKPFTLAGRPQLATFFNEHVIDIIVHKERYKTLGIGFPSAVILHGPPGCGKTFAVETLVEHLGWPCFQIDASSVASPYIHETSKKVAEVFEKAMHSAPSVLVIDEMEAFLADRESGGGGNHHRVEEVAEFLRRIPEAVKNEVLIIGMTNRLEMIDPAIMRRGRFDHVIKVDYASAEEVAALLTTLFEPLPIDVTVDPGFLATKLAGRPLSDVTFVVREGARLAAKAADTQLRQYFLLQALESCPSRTEDISRRPIGFV
ncbi:MAG: ATP-binding protein [Burkholderiales bacterium]